MDTRYADAINRLADAIHTACARADRDGLTAAEIAEELRRIADELVPCVKPESGEHA